MIVPDATRTAPLPLLFDALHTHLRPAVSRLDVLVALGTHPPMSDSQMCSCWASTNWSEDGGFDTNLGLFNHEWDRPEQLLTIGTLTRQDTSEISSGLLSLDVPVQINSRIADYDLFSWSSAPSFHTKWSASRVETGISLQDWRSPEILNFFHWLGAARSPMSGLLESRYACSPRGRPRGGNDPERATGDHFVVASDGNLHGLFYGTPE